MGGETTAAPWSAQASGHDLENLFPSSMSLANAPRDSAGVLRPRRNRQLLGSRRPELHHAIGREPAGTEPGGALRPSTDRAHEGQRATDTGWTAPLPSQQGHHAAVPRSARADAE